MRARSPASSAWLPVGSGGLDLALSPASRRPCARPMAPEDVARGRGARSVGARASHRHCGENRALVASCAIGRASGGATAATPARNVDGWVDGWVADHRADRVGGPRRERTDTASDLPHAGARHTDPARARRADVPTHARCRARCARSILRARVGRGRRPGGDRRRRTRAICPTPRPDDGAVSLVRSSAAGVGPPGTHGR